MCKEIVIINKSVNGAGKAIDFFSKKKRILFSDKIADWQESIKDYISQGYSSFIICGGDGTINQFINSYMKLPRKIRKKITIGIIPCGRANDLARKLKIPFDINEAYGLIKQNRTFGIDLVQVNDKFFVTGGGLGLPAEVILDVNRHSTKFTNKWLRESTYYISVIKKVMSQFSGITLTNVDQTLMFFAVCNQDFIGKRFHLSPDSVIDDGFFETCLIPKPKNAISALCTVQKILKGEHPKIKGCVVKKLKHLKIKVSNDDWFMADGELLEYNHTFEFRIIPKAIRILR